MELSTTASPRAVIQDLSLGELQALCVAATRGAGRAVGTAEDAGRAVRWVAVRGRDGASALAHLLRVTDGRATADLIPALPALTAARDAICPLALGGYLSDMGMLPEGPIGPVWSPLLLQPFLAELSAAGVDVIPETASPASLLRLRPRIIPLPVTRTRAATTPGTLAVLRSFAARTYAPATEESRAKGAGAGGADDD